MITIHDKIIQGSDEWLLARCGSIGSSSVAQAMAGGQGKSRKTLAYNLIAETITGEKTYFKPTPAMEEGMAREDESRKYHGFVTGIEWEEVGMVTNTDFPGQHTSPDAINRKLVCGFEVKNPQANTMVKRLEQNKLPPEYKAQVQHAMMITGWNIWYFLSYHPAFDRQLIIEIKRDDKYIKTMQEKISVFMTELQQIKEAISG